MRKVAKRKSARMTPLSKAIMLLGKAVEIMLKHDDKPVAKKVKAKKRK